MPMADLNEIINSPAALARREAQKGEYDNYVREHGDDRPAVRRAALFVTPDAFVHMCSGIFRVVAHPLPRDARIVGAFYSETRHAFAVVVESEEFAPVKLGDVIPDLPPPVFKRLGEGG